MAGGHRGKEDQDRLRVLREPAAPGAGAQGRDARASWLRQQILHRVEEHPGIHKSALARALGISWGTLSHHLRVLERRKLLRIHPERRECYLFPIRLGEQEIGWLLALRDEGGRIATSLQEHPGRSATELGRLLQLEGRVVRRRLADLVGSGIVDATAEGSFRIRDPRALGFLAGGGPSGPGHGHDPATA
jgi:predicted transcriptional regulator